MNTLSFVAIRDEKTVFWAPERPADYAEACILGRTYAAELHAHMNFKGDTAVFGGVIRAMINGGQWGGVEAGFCQSFGIVLAGVEPVVPRLAA